MKTYFYQYMNDRLIINGSKRLSGNFDVQGSKNESFQVMCACLLTKEKVIIKNLPDITDVASLINIFKLLNVKVEKLSEHDYSWSHARSFQKSYNPNARRR